MQPQPQFVQKALEERLSQETYCRLPGSVSPYSLICRRWPRWELPFLHSQLSLSQWPFKVLPGQEASQL